MSGENFRDILAFLAVARERSFTRAAAQVGVSQSALSHTIRGLESRLGLRLLTRTTRSVSPTEAGERLIQSVAPRFQVIADELAAFNELRDKPVGTVRITTSDFAANTVLWPKLSKLQPEYPDIKIEIFMDPGLTDIVEERYDAGVRFGDQIAKDMTAVQISPDIRMTIVGAPSYLERHPPPKLPSDLSQHQCINTRYSNRSGVYPWELRKGKRNLQARVEGPWTFNSIYPVLDAALAGFGLAYVPEELTRPHLADGRLQAVLKDWCPTFPGLHIFYASRRQSSPALSLIVETLRYRR
ncbi:LysR family transcriptional regulator [Paraburkholderia sp. SIMBA_049]